jgi:DNA-directed RNA polymerase specialized sigma24 family protein
MPMTPVPSSDFSSLIARIRCGDDQAATELVQRFEQPVMRAVRARLGIRMRRLLDSMDVIQSVNRSLLIGLRNEKFDLANPNQLIGLAVVLVQRKVARHWRKLRASASSCSTANSSSGLELVEDLASREPTQVHVVLADELLKTVMSNLDALDQQLVQSRLDGNSSADTAKLLDLDPAFVRMRWVRIRKKLRQYDEPNH